jgi:zinc transport system substrate-binding protein
MVGHMRTGLLLSSLPVALVLVACGSGSSGRSGDGPAVVAAVYPLEFVAERIAGDAGEVAGLTPAGQEPHDIELTTDQIVDVSGADLLVYIGEDFQPALEDVLPEADGEVIDALDSVDVIEVGEQTDPHVWLDPARLNRIVEIVSGELAEIDADNAETYRANAEDLGDRLLELDSNFTKTLDDCERRELVTAHEAFGYLADRYDLEQIGIAGVNPEVEPSPQKLVDIADFVETHDVTTIFFEELVAPDVAETIADETGARTAALHTLESPPESGDYFTAMRENLSALRTALGCS